VSVLLGEPEAGPLQDVHDLLDADAFEFVNI
jgi:hypothetical protein